MMQGPIDVDDAAANYHIQMTVNAIATIDL